MLAEPLDDAVEAEAENEPEPLEAYCVRCREVVMLEDPIPVRTRKGAPATRGECPYCGGVVYRLGKTAAHQELKRRATKIGTKRQHTPYPKTTIYVNHAPADAPIAERVAVDLERMGCAPSLHQRGTPDDAEDDSPPLEACSRMIVLLSPDALNEDSVESAWRQFGEQKKPVVVALIAPATLPDPLRLKPRFDLRSNYKRAFRQILCALHE